MGRYGLQCIGSLKEFFTNDMALDIDTKFFRIRTDPTFLESTYDFTIENKKLKIKYKSGGSDVDSPLFVCFLKNNLIQLKDTNEFFIVMKSTFDPGIYSKILYNTIVWMPPMTDIDNISSAQWNNLFSSPGVEVYSTNQDLSSKESFFHFSILANRSLSENNLQLLNRICYYPSTITLSDYDYSSSGVWKNGGHTVPDSTSDANYIALCYKIPLVSDTLYTYIDDILLYIKPKDLSSEIRANMIYDLYRGLHSLYLPGELIENQNCDTKFTKEGNLMVRNEFEEGLPAAALQNSFEAYELIEY